MSLSNVTQDEYETIARDLMAAKACSLAACVMLFYDMLLTFGEEVDRIWCRKFSLFTALWFANRYISPLGYIVIIVSFHSNWSQEVCSRYVLYPEALKVVTTFVIGAIFIARLYAIYSRSPLIPIVFGILLILQILVKIWSFTDGTYLQLPHGLVGCILVGKHHLRMAFTWISEMVFDTIVFVMTAWRTGAMYRASNWNCGYLYRLILRDGIMYFGLILVVNLLTVLMFECNLLECIQLAPPNLKAINASFSTLMTNLMVSRLILNLRRMGDVREIRGENGEYYLDHATDYGSTTEIVDVHDMFAKRETVILGTIGTRRTCHSYV